jgi:hypothetical protein
LGAAVAFTSSAAKDQITRGADAARVLDAARLPADQRSLWLVGVVNPPATWVTYNYGLDPVELDDAALVRLRVTHPRDVVLLTSWCRGAPNADVCAHYWGARTTGVVGRKFATARIADL